MDEKVFAVKPELEHLENGELLLQDCIALCKAQSFVTLHHNASITAL